MRQLLVIALTAVVISSFGCSGSDVKSNTAPLTDEEKQKIANEDKMIEDQESPGNPTLKGKGTPKPR